VGTGDLQPFFIPTTSIPSWPVFSGGVELGLPCSSYDMEVADSNLSSTNGVGTPIQWNFGPNYNTAASPFFGVQAAIGDVSQLGDILAITTDAMNTRGDQGTGSTTCAHPLRAQYQPSAPQTMTAGDQVMPLGNNPGTHIYQVSCSADGGVTWTAGSCSYVTPIPNWANCQTAGCFTYDPSSGPQVVRFQSLGFNSCRGDILLMDVLSSHIAP
jgi:hypothetical protein